MMRTLVLPLLAALAAPAIAQDAPPAAPPAPASTPAAATDRPVPDRVVGRPATVNNQAITGEDVALQMRLLGSELSRIEPAAREQFARRAVAEEMLLAGEATRLGVQLTDRDVDEWWERRAGSPPDWDAMAAAAGITLARQRDLARRAALADLYLLHKCGLRGDQAARVPPDPLLERVVNVTPSQLREAFAQNHELFDRPESVACDLYVAADAPGRDAIAAALDAGTAPAVAPLSRIVPLAEAGRAFPADVVAWLGVAAPGEHRALDARTLLAVHEHLPAKPATFAEAQTLLHNALLDQLLKEARKKLVDELRDHATYWPPELFSAPQPPADKSPASSATATPQPPSSP